MGVRWPEQEHCLVASKLTITEQVKGVDLSDIRAAILLGLCS
jgi:hypothetical protein